MAPIDANPQQPPHRPKYLDDVAAVVAESSIDFVLPARGAEASGFPYEPGRADAGVFYVEHVLEPPSCAVQESTGTPASGSRLWCHGQRQGVRRGG